MHPIISNIPLPDLIDLYLIGTPKDQICAYLDRCEPDRPTPWNRTKLTALLTRCSKGLKEGAELTAQTQSLLRTMIAQNASSKPTVHLLFGKLFCDCSNERMKVESKRKKYSCPSCKNSVPMHDIETIVLDDLRPETIPQGDQITLPVNTNHSTQSSAPISSTTGVYDGTCTQNDNPANELKNPEPTTDATLDMSNLTFQQQRLLIDIRIASITYIQPRSEIIIRKFPLS